MAATSGGASETDRPWQSYHTVYTNAKAGMEGVDKEKIQKIIYEMSKGSKYFENEQRKESIINEKVEKLRLHQTNLTENEISHFQMIADNKIVELEATRDLSKVWLHVDMDAFYAAIETLEKPLLKEKPLAVGSMSMICTANYEARKYGVRAAMPGFIARKLCSKLILVPTNMEKYCHYSGMTRKVFHKYDPNFMAAGLDEAYLDVTTVCNDLKKSGEQIAEELRSGVFEATGLTCSAGIAPNRLLAKVCSDINKPNGQFVLPNDRRAVMAFISSLPIRKISGIGKVTEQVLKNLLGISTCEEMLSKRAFICALFSSCSSDFFLSVALGIGQTSTSWKPRRSISTERTFSSTSVEALLHEKLADIAETLSIDMQKDGLRGRTLTLKLKTASFEVRTRAVSLRRYIFSKDDILAHATKLLKDEMPISLRLIGLRMSQLNDDLSVEDPTQKTLDSFFLSDVMPVNDISCNYFDNSTDDDCKKEEAGFTFSFKSQEPLLSNLDINGKRTADPIKWLDSNSASYCLTPCRVGETEKGFRPIDSTGRPNQEETEKLDVSCFGTNLTDSEDVPSSIVEQQPFWINDSRCSVCGLELPPSFSMERQEHSDYHLAEMLQKEECPVPAQRTVHAHGSIFVKKNGRKRHKSSPTEVKQNRIDRFFVKDKL